MHIDLTANSVIRVEDHGDVPVPAGHGNYYPEVQGEARTTLKPIEITQPEGPSFAVTGSLVEWEGWSMRVDFNAREGLVLHDVTFQGRSVLSRASVPEMVVPYGDTAPGRFWISYFDAGEYLLGKNANHLELGCDCLGVIRYLDGYVADDHGHPVRIPNVICMHEEDYGILWKHTDLAGRSDVRRSRRFVVSYFSTIGNYDYGFYWNFGLDGSIEVVAKATGIVFASAGEPGVRQRHATELAPGVFAPVHQHLFCARLDVAIDGEDNRLVEIDAQRVPMGPENPFGNAFHLVGDDAAHRERGAARGRFLGRTGVGGAERVPHEPRRPTHRVPPGAAAHGTAHGRPAVLRRRACRLRDEAPLGDALRSGADLAGRSVSERAPGRSRAARVRRRRPRHRRPGHRAVAHLRSDALPATGGLAHHAGRLRRILVQTSRIPRPEPGHGCAGGVAGAPRRDGERMLRRRHLHLRALSRMPARGRRTETPGLAASARRALRVESAPAPRLSTSPRTRRPTAAAARDPAPFLRHEELHHGRDVAGAPETPERCHLRQPAARLVVHPAGVDGPGVEHVRRDAARAELAGRRDHEPVESALGGP